MGKILSGIIGPALDAGVSLFNTAMQARQNKKDRQFQERMYMMQRSDARADYDAQNAYNTPQAQMERYKKAGLNMNLVYGTAGQSAAADIRGSQPSGGNQPAPQLQENMLAKALQGFMQIINTQQETQNLQKQAELIAAETERNKFELSRGKEMLPYQLTAADLGNKLTEATIAKTEADIEFTINSDQRAAIRQGADLKLIAEQILRSQMERLEAAQRIAKSKLEQDEIEQRIRQIKALTSGSLLDNQLKAFDVDMANQGINPKDPSYIRNFQKLLDEMYNSTGPTPQNRDKNHSSDKGTMKR